MLWKLQSQLFFLKINRAQTGQEPPESWHEEERNRRKKPNNSERLYVCILRWREMTMNDWINRQDRTAEDKGKPNVSKKRE